MNLQNFLTDCKLPQDWEPIVRMEALTGCSVCQCRLIHDEKLRPGTTIVRVYDKDSILNAVFVLCKEHAPK